jgi:hypothetical protein
MRAGLGVVAFLAVLLTACGREGPAFPEPATPTQTLSPSAVPLTSVEPSPTQSPGSPTPTITPSVVVTPTPTAVAVASQPPSTTPQPSRPPDAYLRSRAGERRGNLGSYCWNSGGQGLCADSAAPQGRPKSGLRIGQKEAVILRYATSQDPRDDPRIEFWQDGKVVGKAITQNRNPAVFRVAVPPGRYWLLAFARWTQGDTSHTFPIDVR